MIGVKVALFALVLLNCEMLFVAPPFTVWIVQVPVPELGAFAANVAPNRMHTAWSAPAFEVVGFEFTTTAN